MYLEAEVLHAIVERGAARVLSKDEVRVVEPDRLRRHDLVRQRVLQHAVLVDAGLVRECVGADDRLPVDPWLAPLVHIL